MDQRKRLILQAVTDDYISTAEPVGSRTIARRYRLGLSPATIRNEMADLEEGGYLEQPHTSAGRIPSEKGYRFYVDSLMRPQRVSPEMEAAVRAYFDRKFKELEAVIQTAARVVADVTRYACLVMGPRFKTSTFRNMNIVPLGEGSALVVLVTQSAILQPRVVPVSLDVSADELNEVCRFLNSRLAGLTLGEIGSSTLREIHDEVERYGVMFQRTIDQMFEAVEEAGEDRVYAEGSAHLLEYPEFREISRAKPVLEMLGDRGLVSDLVADAPADRVGVSIGSENRHHGMKSCTLVVHAYEIAGHKAGAIGVVGPTRMEYQRVVGLVDFMSGLLGEVLSRVK